MQGSTASTRPSLSAEHAGKRIAVVGGGVAGIVAAYLLQRRHHVALFERNSYVGGHTNTIIVENGPDAGAAIDTGFIVANDRTYPLFKRFLSQLGVGVRKSDMSFGVHCERTGLQYASMSFNAIFAQRRNALRPSFLSMLRDIVRFNRIGSEALLNDHVDQCTLGDFVREHKFGQRFNDCYLTPMAAAIWSCPTELVRQFPAKAFLRFFSNHGLLTVNQQPTWETVVGGSHAYVKAFLRSFRGTVALNSPVAGVTRGNEAVWIELPEGRKESFDFVVLAGHADEALRTLRDPSEEERRLLGAWRYQENLAVLHTDTDVMPPNRRAWASWNYCREAACDGSVPVSVTYDMNRLQGLRTRERYLVSLNRRRSIAESKVLRRIRYAHPVYTFESMASQEPIRRLNGERRTFYCGSYLGYGFHEDAVRSAVAVAQCFGLDL